MEETNTVEGYILGRVRVHGASMPAPALYSPRIKMFTNASSLNFLIQEF